MTTLVAAKNFDVTKGIRQHVEGQSSKVKRLTDRVKQIKVYLESVGRRGNNPNANQAKVVLEVPGKDVVVIKKAGDMYQTISLAFSAAARHLRRQIEKRQSKKLQK